MIAHGRYLIDPQAGKVHIGDRQLRGRRNTCGYLQIDSGTFGCSLIHRLVWEAVHGPVPAGREINHLNGDKTDNRIGNLELATRSSNMRHAFISGLARRKLDIGQVREIRARLAAGEPMDALAAEFGVSQSNIYQIRTHRIWKEAA